MPKLARDVKLPNSVCKHILNLEGHEVAAEIKADSNATGAREIFVVDVTDLEAANKRAAGISDGSRIVA